MCLSNRAIFMLFYFSFFRLPLSRAWIMSLAILRMQLPCLSLQSFSCSSSDSSCLFALSLIEPRKRERARSRGVQVKRLENDGADMAQSRFRLLLTQARPVRENLKGLPASEFQSFTAANQTKVP